MRPTEPNKQRRKTLAKALKECEDGHRLSLEELSVLWGTAKTRFVNVKGEMIRAGFDFPPAEQGPRNRSMYDAKRALTVMLDFETRNDQSANAKDKVLKSILGQDEEAEKHGIYSISELAQLNRQAAWAEDRAREQGKYTTLADQAAAAGRVFSYLSDFFGDLEARLDPNGQLAPEIRAKLRQMGNDGIVKIYEDMKELLSDDPKPQDQKRRRSAKRAD